MTGLMIDHFDVRSFCQNRVLRTPPRLALTRKVRLIYPFPLFHPTVITYGLDWLRDQFVIFPRLEQTLWGNVHGSDLAKCLKVPEFQFKKKRMMFVQLLDADYKKAEESQDAKDSQDANGLSTDLTRSVADTVMRKQDEKSIVTYLETFKKVDKGIISRVLGFFRSSSEKEELWQSARDRTRTILDSQFLSELKDIPVEHYLHAAAIDVEEMAYDLLKKKVETAVSVISRQILSMRKTEREEQVKLEVEIDEDQEVQIEWSNFVHQVKEISTQRSKSYVPYGARNWMIT
jgi:hypothetical protein